MVFWMSSAYASSFTPAAATDIAAQWDNLYGFLLISSLIGCLILIGGMIYFVVKYKRKSDKDVTPYISHNTALEFLWSFIPLVIFLAIFGWGWWLYHDMRKMPTDGLEIHINGKQWAWEAIYKSGVKTGNLVVAPINTDVKLIMSSSDVLHSFFLPAFRIKQDVVPGRYTALWFRADKMGEFHIFCAEYCGTEHSGMIGTLKIVSKADYDAWLEEESNVGALPLLKRGEKIFGAKACASCHSIADASRKVGPSLWQRFGTNERFEDGSETTIDENYLRESILNPKAKIVAGYQPVMPSFQGQLSEVELTALIEYVKSLK